MEKQVLDYPVLIEQDEDGWFVAVVPDIPGCYTQGKTATQAIERIKEAIECCLEADVKEIATLKPMRFIGVQNVRVVVPA